VQLTKEGRIRAGEKERKRTASGKPVCVSGPATEGKRHWKTSTQILEEEMMLRERAEAAEREIGYYPPSESGMIEVPIADHLALISRTIPTISGPLAVIRYQYHQTVTAIMVTSTQIPVICPPSALCRNLKASLIVGALLRLPLHLWVALYRPLHEQRIEILLLPECFQIITNST